MCPPSQWKYGFPGKVVHLWVYPLAGEVPEEVEGKVYTIPYTPTSRSFPLDYRFPAAVEEVRDQEVFVSQGKKKLRLYRAFDPSGWKEVQAALGILSALSPLPPLLARAISAAQGYLNEPLPWGIAYASSLASSYAFLVLKHRTLFGCVPSVEVLLQNDEGFCVEAWVDELMREGAALTKKIHQMALSMGEDWIER